MMRALELTDRGLPPLIARFVFDVGQTISTPVLLAGAALLRLRLPNNLTGTQLQLQSSLDGTNWTTVLDPALGSPWGLTVVANSDVYIGPAIGTGLHIARLVSSAAQNGSPATVIGIAAEW